METKKIFHYTNIDSLRKILETKSLKFGSLKNMDDPLEYLSNDIDVCKGIYVSSWTDVEEEKIEMWSMYTAPDTAIRIEITNNPFETVLEDLNDFFLEADTITHNQGSIAKGLEMRHLSESGLSVNPPFVPQLIKVEYIPRRILELLTNSVLSTKNTQEVLPNGTIKNSIVQKIDLSLFGEFKSMDWSFQHELRFKVILLPCTNDEMLIKLKEINKTLEVNFFEWLKWKYDNCNNFPESIFIQLKNETLDNMKVTIGPNVSEENREVIRKIIIESGYKISVKESDIQIRFRNSH